MDDAVEPLLDYRVKLSPVEVRVRSHDVRLRLLEQRNVRTAPAEATPGPEGPPGPMPQHEWSGTELRFQQGPDGAWGEWVDLRGPAGATRWIPAPASGGGGPVVINGYWPQGW